jgi:hypothetical protein
MHIWKRLQSSAPAWGLLPLPADTSVSLHATAPHVRRGATPTATAELHVTNGDSWALICTPDAPLRVNGEPVALGIRVLRDRDEITMAGCSPMYVSTERLAAIEPFSGDAPAACPRCRMMIAPETDAVKCPACGIWHHEDASNSLTCWSYHLAATCSHCPQPNTLADDAAYIWTPEDL